MKSTSTFESAITAAQTAKGSTLLDLIKIDSKTFNSQQDLSPKKIGKQKNELFGNIFEDALKAFHD
jgi:hypothetical protein